MKLALGKADKLIDDKNYRSMFRNRQKRFPQEFEMSVKIAKTKKSPSRYFSKIWSKKNCDNSVTILRKIINSIKSKKRENSIAAKKLKDSAAEALSFCASGRAQFEALKSERMKSNFTIRS